MWSTIASWITLLALAAVVTHYYNPQLLQNILSQKQENSPTVPDTIKLASKRQKSRRTPVNKSIKELESSPYSSSTENSVTKKRKISSIPVTGSVQATTVVATKDSPFTEDHEITSSRDFAQKLSKTQAGTQFKSPNQNTNKIYRQNLTSAQTGQDSQDISTETSSVEARDADDDLSPSGSPPSGSVSTAPTSRAGDISDMLETPQAKPTTLRLTDVKDSKPSSSLKAFEPVLSKKQRQRKARQEENRELRQEADRIQEAQKQAQLRTARVAAGTSNQTRADAFVSSAWNKNGPAVVNSSPTQTSLLDTFEKSTDQSTAAQTPALDQKNEWSGKMSDSQSRNSAKTNIPPFASHEGRPDLVSKTSWADLVDEEEQNNWAHELVREKQWESVTTKKTKKGKRDADSSSEASATLSRPLLISNGTRTSSTKPQTQNVNRFSSMGQVAGGSDWEA